MRSDLSCIIVISLVVLMGIPYVAATTLNVGPGQTYTTIQAAINAAAASGDIIVVAPGTYNEHITITKAVTLRGATYGVSKKGFAVPAGYAYDPATQSIIMPSSLQDEPVVDIRTGNVVFDGFIVAVTVAKPYPINTSVNLIGMTAAGPLNDVIIQNNVLGPDANLTTQDGNSGSAAIGILKHSPVTDTVYNLQIRNNKIFDAKGDGCGIFMTGAMNTSTSSLPYQYKGAVIDNNEITGNHRSGIEFAGGVQGGSAVADHIRITNNIITNNGWGDEHDDKDDLKWGNGIVFIRMADDVTNPAAWASRYINVTNNQITGNEKNGIYMGPITRDLTITGNTIDNNGVGGGGWKKWDGVSIDLDEDYYTGTKYQNYTYLTNILINNNEISGNGGSSRYGVNVIQIPQSGPVDARNNWWGAASGPKGPGHESGGGDKVSDNVLFSPWYTDAAMLMAKPVVDFTASPTSGTAPLTVVYNDTSTGSPTSWYYVFGDLGAGNTSTSQNTTHTYNNSGIYTVSLTASNAGGSNTTTKTNLINVTSTQPPSGSGTTRYVGPGNYTTIQAAINAAATGDIIVVFPGTYDERIVINKSVTLRGATYGVSKKGFTVPGGYAHDAATQSIIRPSANANSEVVRIELGNVVFDGFIVANTVANSYPDYPLTNLIGLSNQSHDYLNVRIQNNVIGPNTNTISQDGNKGRGGIVYYGPSAALVRNLTIAQNKIFDQKGDGCGIMLLGSVNSTAQTMTSTLGLNGKYAGSVIDGNEITGNHRSGIEFAGGVQGGATAADRFRITNNTITNNGWNSTIDKDFLKYGNGIVFIHVRSDKENVNSWGARNVTIENNQISGNEKNGIYIGPINRDITITNNSIRDNGVGTGGYSVWDNIRFDLDESYHSPTYKNYAFLTNISLRDNEIRTSGGFGVNVIQTPQKGPVDAKNNWWGAASGPQQSPKNPFGTGNPVSNNILFSPWYTNAGKTTLSTGSGTTLIVGPGNYTTIQAAITAAATGDIIMVSPGMYNERITINKAVTLRGATYGVSKKGFAVPAGYAYDATTQSIIQPSSLQDEPVVDITTGNVTFDGFVVAMTVAKAYPTFPSTYLIRMTAGGPLNNVTIQNNVLGPDTNVTAQDGRSGRAIICISKHSPGTDPVYNLQIRNNKIFDAKGDGCGIMMIGSKNTSASKLQHQFSGALIDNNEITGNHRSGIDFSAGVQGGEAVADHIHITNNLITNNGFGTADADVLAYGNGIIFVRMTDDINNPTPWASRYIHVENNQITGNEKNGIYMGPITRDLTITGNTIQNNGAGGGVNKTWDGIRIDLDEALKQPPSSLTIYSYLSNILIKENEIRGNGGSSGYGINISRTPQSGPVDTRNNWWGAASGPQQSPKNPFGTGNRVSNNVLFSPWYTNSGKTTLSSGSGTTLMVGPGNYTSIQAAINAAQSGDIIMVAPGLYNERIVINKSVTLQGATYSVSKKGFAVPGDYAYNPATQSIIRPSTDKNEEVVRIELGNVVFDGFVVANTVANAYPGNAITNLIALNNQSCDYTDVSIRNNVIGPNTNTNTKNSQDGTKGGMGIAVYGPSAAMVHNLIIANNKIFDAQGDGSGILLLGSVNSTAQTMTSTIGLTGKYAGSVIDGNEITGNHRSGIEFGGGVQGGATAADRLRITNNIITNNGWGKTADKNEPKYGNGIIFIRVSSDRTNPNSWGAQNITIENNQISDNEKNGIYLGPVNRNITLANNIIRENGKGTRQFKEWDGIRIDLDEDYYNGQKYQNYAYLTGISALGNDIIANGDYGVNVSKTPQSGPVDAKNNWWGAASGPKHTSSNPTGAGNRVSDNVLFAPWYSESSKTSTQTYPPPIASFTWTPFEVMTDQEITFDASASRPQSDATIQIYEWTFGDGTITSATLPSITHSYQASKVYAITLLVKDSRGITNQFSRQVSVIAQKKIVPLAFNFTKISGISGAQKLTFNTSTISTTNSSTSGSSNTTISNTTTEVRLQNPGNGWTEMVVKGNTSTGSAGEITIQNITEVVLKGATTVTQLNQSAGGVGNVSTSIQLSLKEFVEAPLEINIVEGANTTVSNAFQLAAGTGQNVDAVAYSMEIRGSSLINSNLSSSAEPVKLNMSVSEDWVLEHGGIPAIRVMRYADGGTKVEQLQTNYLFTRGTPRMCDFEVISPNGCSIFSIISVSSYQVVESAQASGYSYAQNSDNGGSDSVSGPTSAPAPAPTSSPTKQVPTVQPSQVPPEQTAPPELQIIEGARGIFNAITAILPVPETAGLTHSGILDAIVGFVGANLGALLIIEVVIGIGLGAFVWRQR